MVYWTEPEWPQPGEKAVIHYSVRTWESEVGGVKRTSSTVTRLLMVGRDPFGPGGSLDGRIKRSESKERLARIVAQGKVENDLRFDLFASEVFSRVVHGAEDDETRVLAAEQSLLIKTSKESPKPVCMVCCRERGADPAVRFHRKTRFPWMIGSQLQTSTIQEHGPATVSSTVCLACLQMRYANLIGIKTDSPTLADQMLSSPFWNINDPGFMVKLCGWPSFRAGLDQLSKVVSEVANS